jgi:hypothetical protein
VATDEQLAFQCSRIILEDIFKGVGAVWDRFLDLATDHVSILEDKVYEQPADETRAPELWLNSSLWLKVEKLMFVHIDVVKEMRVRLQDLAGKPPFYLFCASVILFYTRIGILLMLLFFLYSLLAR